MKRHVHLPSRTVAVEDGVVKDLDGNELGEVMRAAPGRRHGWIYRVAGRPHRYDGVTRDWGAAVAALVADPSCPAGGDNHYDLPGRTR